MPKPAHAQGKGKPDTLPAKIDKDDDKPAKPIKAEKPAKSEKRDRRWFLEDGILKLAANHPATITRLPMNNSIFARRFELEIAGFPPTPVFSLREAKDLAEDFVDELDELPVPDETPTLPELDA